MDGQSGPRPIKVVGLWQGDLTAGASPSQGPTLYVTDGIGLVATRDGGVQEIRPGDVVYIEPGEDHWHGATPDRFMAHVAMQEAASRARSGRGRRRVAILNRHL